MMKYLNQNDNFEKNRSINSVLKVGGGANVYAPLVSIVIPTFRRVDTLEEALQSAVSQHGCDYEIIVIDNDWNNIETENLVRRYSRDNLFYYQNDSNIGMIGNWNRGIELARGEWIVLLHDDDILHPDFLASVIHHCQSHAQLVCGKVLFGGHNDAKIFWSNVTNGNYKKSAGYEKSAFSVPIDRFLRANQCFFPAIIFKKDSVMRLGGFNEAAYPIHDYVMWMQLGLQNGIRKVDSLLGFYRVSDFHASASFPHGFYKFNLEARQELYELLPKSFCIKLSFFIGVMRQVWGAQAQYKLEDVVAVEQFFDVKLRHKILLVGLLCRYRVAKVCYWLKCKLAKFKADI